MLARRLRAGTVSALVSRKGAAGGRALEFFVELVGACAAVLPDEISDPPHYCVDDGQHRDHAQSWSRLSEQFFRFDKWSLCRG